MVMANHWYLQSIALVILFPLVYSTCVFDGKRFEAYTVVYKVYDETNDWCYVGLCKHDGEIWRLVDLTCRRRPLIGKTTESTKRTTTSASTTTETATTFPITQPGTFDGVLS